MVRICRRKENLRGARHSPLFQHSPYSRDEHIKMKLLASPSRWAYALVVFSLFSSTRSVLQPLIAVLNTANKKYHRHTRCEPSNPNPLQFLQGVSQTTAIKESCTSLTHTCCKIYNFDKEIGRTLSLLSTYAGKSVDDPCSHH
jgi:hypothetical protein